MFDIIKNIFKWLCQVGWKYLGVPLIGGILGIMVVGRAIDWYAGPKSYNVYLVGDLADPNLQKLRLEYEKQQNQQKSLKIANVDIRYISLEAKEKDAAKISAKLAEEDDTLLVVGHLSTTASANALPSYLNASPPIPVILANETNPELLPADYHINYAPVFRLSPTDNKQAERAAEFVIHQGAKNIWVVEDVITNNIYSRYLAQEFVHQVHTKHQAQVQVQAKNQVRERRSVYDANQSSTNIQPYEKRVSRSEYSKVVLWTTNMAPPSTDVLHALKIGWVFFAGSASNCLILTRQVNEVWKDQTKPDVLLASSCANPELLKQGGEDIKQAYLTHPMLASDFNERGFEIRGAQAFQLLSQLIANTDYEFSTHAAKQGGVWYYVRWVLGIHRVGDARNALRAFMEQAVNSDHPFLLDGQRYTFNRDGTAKETEFHVWQVLTPSKESKFTDVDIY